MLEKFSKDVIFCDAHFHLAQSALKENIKEDFFKDFTFWGCSCAHDRQEFFIQKELIKKLNYSGGCNIVSSFGLHPQMPIIENADFLEKLLQENEICCIGEAGFDLFTPEFKSDLKRQEKAWSIQLELALKYNKTLVVHCRKALDFMFRDCNILKKLPAVLFHSFPAGGREALALLSKGINAYFSLGKQLVKGNKHSLSCIDCLPVQKILLETDAPFQTLKGETFTSIADIRKLYKFVFDLYPDFSAEILFANFKNIFVSS